jgi:hypothetical protein
MGGPTNQTRGSGRYSAVKSYSVEVVDTLVWLISPLVDVENYQNLTLEADLYLHATGTAGEDTLTVSLLTIDGGGPGSQSVEEHTVEVVGENLSFQYPDIQGSRSALSRKKDRQLMIIASGLLMHAVSFCSTPAVPA